jgi:hypothetical protein
MNRPLRIRMILDPTRARVWHRRLAETLRHQGHAVSIATATTTNPVPLSVNLLMTLERLVYGQKDDAPGMPWQPASNRTALDDADDLVLNMTSAPAAAASTRTLRPVYAGALLEDAAISTLLSGRAPDIGILDSTEKSPHVYRAAVERPRVLCKAMDNIGARLETIFVKAVTDIASGRTLSGDAGTLASPSMVGLASAIAQRARTALTSLASTPPHWFVGWRRVNNDRIADTMQMPRQEWTRLPDDGARFFADPFLFQKNGRTWLFLEEYQYSIGKALLSVVEIGTLGLIGSPRPILERPYHLSYPFVFERDGEIWMLPEMSSARRVELLRSTNFPFEWEPAALLIDGEEISDATIVDHQSKLWLFASVSGDGASSWDNLHLWSAPSLKGEWRSHPRNPVLVDAAAARPAGAMYRRGDQLWRPAQDCTGGYGSALTLARVTRLDDEDYAQQNVASLRPGALWPGIALHTLNTAGEFEVIDGATAGRSRPR